MAVSKCRVTLFDLAPGAGGAQRMVVPALAAATLLDVDLIGSKQVVEFASHRGVASREFALPGVRTPVLGALRLAFGGSRLAMLQRRSQSVLYANNSRAIGYGLAARKLRAFPFIAHNHEILRPGRFSAQIESTADLVIVPSKAAAAPFGSSAKVAVLYSGVDLDRFSVPLERSSAKAALGIPQVPVVGCVARADPSKGMMEFLQLAQIVAAGRKDAHFLLAGGPVFPHERAHFEEVKQVARRMGDRTTMTGAVADTSPLYAAMDLVVHLGEAESLSTTTIEACASGVPSVAYSWGGMEEIVGDGGGVLIQPGDVESAAEAVGALLSRPEDLKEASRRARAIAEDKFSYSRFVRELEQLVLSVCEH